MNKLHTVGKVSAILLAISLTALLSGCNESKKSIPENSKSGMSDTATDIFSQKKIEIPEEFNGTPEFLCSSNKIYLSGYTQPDSSSNIALTMDISTGETEKIDVSGINGQYIVAQCMNKDMIYFSYHNNDNNIRLCCLSIKTGKLIADVDTSAQSYVTSMQFDSEKNRLITMNSDSSGESVVYSLNAYDPETLELLDSVNLNEKLSLSKNDYLNTMMISNQDGYYFVSYNTERGASEYTLYKFTSDLENIYTVSDFGDTPGELTDAFISSDSDICIVTVDYENKKCYINKLGAADGQSLNVYDVSEEDFFAILKYAPVKGYDFTYTSEDGIYGYIMEDKKSVLLAPVETTGSSFEFCTGVASYDNKLFMLAVSYENVNKKKVYVFDDNAAKTDEIEISAEEPEGYIEMTAVSPDGKIYGIEAFSGEDQDNYSINYCIHSISSDGKVKNKYSPDQLSNLNSTYIEKMIFSPDNDLYLIMSQYQSSGEEKMIMVFDSDGNLKNQIRSYTDIFDLIFTEENDYIVYKDKDDKVSLSAIDYQNNKTGEQIVTDVPEVLKYSFYSGTGKYDAFYKLPGGIYGYNIKDKKSVCLFDQKKSETDITPDSFFVINDNKIAASVFDTDKGSSSYYILTRK